MVSAQQLATTIVYAYIFVLAQCLVLLVSHFARIADDLYNLEVLLSLGRVKDHPRDIEPYRLSSALAALLRDPSIPRRRRWQDFCGICYRIA